MRNLVLCLLVLAAQTFAADVSGEWKATAQGANGPMERTFSFKAEGGKLTGETTSSLLGKSTIQDGKVEGDAISFTITAKFRDNEMKLTYKGKMAGENELRLSSEFGGGQTIEWQAKRASK